MLKIGVRAPAFNLADQDAHQHTLEKYKGSWVLLYFYPKDNTPGCTVEACSFRDVWQELKEEGMVVLGISPDTVESHQKFASKYSLPFPLLSDPEKKTLIAYGAWGEKSMYGKKYMGVLRSSVLIDPESFIVKLYPKVSVLKHAQEVLNDVLKMKDNDCI